MKNKIYKGLKNILIPLLIFGVVTFVFYPKLFTEFNSSIEKNDGRLLAWTIAWDNHKLLTDPLGIFQANIYYPNENTLTYSEHFIGGSILAMPVYLITDGSPVASFNFLMILGFVMNAFSGFFLVKYLTKNYYSGIIGGLVMGFSSYRVISYAHLQNMLVFYIPFAVYSLIKYKETKQKRWLVPLGLCLFMQSITSWYHMVFIFGAIFLLVLYFFYKKDLKIKNMLQIGATFAVVLLMIAPLAIPYLKFSSDSDASYTIADQKAFSADFGGYLLPPPNTIIEDKITSEIGIKKTRWTENFNFLGYISLSLAVFGLFRYDKKSKYKFKIEKNLLGFIGIFLAFGILSFGPFLHFLDKQYRIPLPYIFVYYLLPPLRFIRAVSRYSTVVVAMFSILVGFGYLKFLNKLKIKKTINFIALTTIFGAMILFEYYPVVKLNPQINVSEVPEVYTYIKKNDEIKALVELPIDVDPFVTTGYVYNSGIHFKPIVNGYSGYEPKDYVFSKLILKDNISDIGLNYLNELGVTHILLNPGYEIADTTYLEKIFSSDGYSLYSINMKGSGISGEIEFFNKNYKYNSNGVVYLTEGVKIHSEGDDSKPYPRISLDKDGQGELTISSQQNIRLARFNLVIKSEESSIEFTCGKNGFLFEGPIKDNLVEINCEDSKSIKVGFIGSTIESPEITRLVIVNE